MVPKIHGCLANLEKFHMYHDNHQSTYLVWGIKEIFNFLPLSFGLLSDGFFSKKYIQLKKLHKTIIKKIQIFCSVGSSVLAWNRIL